jgi:uracil-DNA glycosylase
VLTAWPPDTSSVAPDWRPLLDQFLASSTGLNLGRFLSERLVSGAVVYPPEPFRAFALTPLSTVKVVILGQDPYHGPGQAEGMAFSVPPGIRPPPSLRNLFKEIAGDPGLVASAPAAPTPDASLVRWASQGVLLLNTCLTVEAGAPASHAKRGWEVLTDAIVQRLAAQQAPVVFMLWGSHAQAKRSLIDSSPAAAQHLVLTANHPSPLSALRPPVPFIGCGHFGRANAFLQQRGLTPIRWQGAAG